MINNIEKILCQLSVLQESISHLHKDDVQQINESKIFLIESISQNLNNSLVRFLLDEQRKDDFMNVDMHSHAF